MTGCATHRRLCLFPVLLLLAARVSAVDLPNDQDQVVPCRPTISCTANIEAPGIFAVEAGVEYAHGGTDSTITPVLLKQSLTTWLQLQAGSNGYTLLQGDTHAQYLANILFGPKFHLLNEGESVPAMAVSAQVGVPSNPTRGFVRTYDVLLVGYLSKDFGKVHVDFNAGLDIGNLPGTAVPQYFLALAGSTSLTKYTGFELEAYFFYNSNLAPNDGGIRVALTFPLRSWLVLDCGADIGFYWPARYFSVFGGISIIPVVFWRPAPS
jgi:hypothetical protein